MKASDGSWVEADQMIDGGPSGESIIDPMIQLVSKQSLQLFNLLPLGKITTRASDGDRLEAAAGHTVILITHDPNEASAADRVIRIEDGLITSDKGRGCPKALPSLAASGGAEAGKFAPPLSAWLEEAAGSAFAAFAVNPVRTALTLSGIVIGVASVVAMLAIGRGAQASYMEKAAAIGTNWVVVSRAGDSAATSQPLTPADAEALKDIANVSGSMPGMWEKATFQHGHIDVAAK